MSLLLLCGATHCRLQCCLHKVGLGKDMFIIVNEHVKVKDSL